MDYTLDQLTRGLANAKAAGNEEAVREIEAEIARMQATEAPAQTDIPGLLPARPQPVSSITGMTPSEAQARGEEGLQALKTGTMETVRQTPAAALRYGPAIAAGIATGGAGFLPAALAGAGSMAGGETLARVYEDLVLGKQSENNARAIGAAGIAGFAVPVAFRPAAPAAGQAVINFLTNAGIMTAANETARLVEKGDFEPITKGDETVPEAALQYLTRFGPAVGIAGVGTGISSSVVRQQARIDRAKAVRDVLGGADPGLGQVVPALAQFEAKAFQKGSKEARRIVDNMDANIGAAIKTNIIDGAPNPDEVARELLPYTIDLPQLRQAASTAKQRAAQLTQQATDALGVDLKLAQRLSEEADAAAVEAVKARALATEGSDKMLGNGINDVSDVATGLRMERTQELAKAADDSVSLGLGGLYKTANIGMDAPVARVAQVRANIGRVVSDQVKSGELLEAFDAAIKKQGMLTNGGDLTLAGYRNIRDLVVDGLVASGKKRSAATRVAGQAYEAIRSASDSYISKVYPQNIVDSFRSANKAASSVFQADTGIIGDLREGNIRGVVELIEEQGYGPALKQIDAYATALAGVGDPASRAAAKQFKANVAGSIRDHLVETSLRLGEGIDDASKALDVSKLVKRVDTLRQKGVPPEALGFPNQDSIKAIARVAATPNRALTKEGLQRFMDDVALSGVPIAEARMAYDDALVKYLTATNAAESANELRRLNKLRDQAKFDAGEADAALDRAQADPLVRLFNEPGISVSPNVGANPEYVNRLLSAGPEGVRRLTKALEAPVPNNPQLTAQRRLNLANLKRSAIADVFGESFRAAISPGDQRVKVEQLTDFFFGVGQKTEREAFRALIGKQEFNNLQKNYIEGLRMTAEHRRNLGLPMSDLRQAATFLAGTAGQLQNKSSGGFIFGQYVGRSVDFIRNELYNVFYGAYVDPKWSNEVLKFKGNLDAFANANPRNAIAYQMWLKQDEEAKRERLQRQSSATKRPQQSPAR